VAGPFHQRVATLYNGVEELRQKAYSFATKPKCTEPQLVVVFVSIEKQAVDDQKQGHHLSFDKLVCSGGSCSQAA